MRFVMVLSSLLVAATAFGQSIVTPVFVHKDGEASATGYNGSQKDIYVDGGSQQSVGWITFQTSGIDFSKVASAKLLLYVKSVTNPGTLQTRIITADITAPENNVPKGEIPSASTVTATALLGSSNVENMLQIDLTAAVKSRMFYGIALTSDDGLSAAFDSKEGHLAPVILLTHSIDGAAAKWLSGTTDPENSLGKDGDIYLNTATGVVSSKSSGTWSVTINIVGPRGAQGSAGAKGDKGDKGDTGATGPQGFAGEKGDKGDQGIQGPVGLTGATGPQGPAGIDGKSIAWRGMWSADSTYAPNSAISYNGSSYIALNASTNKNPADSIAYWHVMAIMGGKGDQGDQGPIGLTGTTGAQGSAGEKGEKGDQGPIGLTGATGAQGPAGEKGDKGDQGAIGSTGATGAQGPAGEKGDKGDQGPIGLTGATGAQGPAGVKGDMGADGSSIVWRGAWNGELTYNNNDAVSFLGSSYIAVSGSTNKVPADSVSYWKLMAKKGDNGDKGDKGDPGDPGVALDDAQALTTKTWSSSKINSELGKKVDAVAGKGLSTKDYTAADSNRLAATSGKNTGDQDLSGFATNVLVSLALSGKVDKVTGKGLSTKDFTAADSARLATVAAGTAVGDMQYWNGAKWVMIAAGKPGQIITNTLTKTPVWQYPSHGTMSDTDGNIYNTVRIGNQEWTIENLRTTKYNDGTPIQLDTTSKTWRNGTTGKYCIFDNADSNKVAFGALYNWYAVNTGKLAPKGWHVPSDAEWDTLKNYLIAHRYNWDGTKDSNRIAISLAAKSDWNVVSSLGAALPAGSIGNNLNRNNRSEFSALGVGYRININGSFSFHGRTTCWWSATAMNGSLAWIRSLQYNYPNVGLTREIIANDFGLSVRLVRDLN